MKIMFMNELQDFEFVKFQYHKENLHNVFGTVLDAFPHITGATVTGQVYLWDVLQKIKYNLAYDIDPNTYLLDKYINGIRNTVYDDRKEQLPAVCYNARFNGYKDTKHLNSITNLMFLDIDDFPTKQEALDYKKQIITNYSWIVACNLSLSRLGLHVIALVDNIQNSTDYTNKYKFISSTYFENRLDKDSNKLTQYAVLPFDYDIYINQYPEILPIEQIYSEYKKGIGSAYIQGSNLSHYSIDEKGISSAYNIDGKSSNSIDKGKGICSVYKKEEIIYTPYTFFSNSHLNNLMNDAARKNNLRFIQEVDESYFQDPNIPIYIREGINVMDARLYKLRGEKVLEGNRHNFIGAFTVEMIYINIGSPDNYNSNIRKEILKFILHLNKTVCEPPMTHDEVIKSYNANWKRFMEGKIDFTNYFTKQRAFWSKQSTLTANEKRSVTCKIKNAPKVEDSKRRIWEAMEQLAASREKITQPKVSELSGLSISTVKNYRKEYHEYKRMLRGETDILEIDENSTSKSNITEDNTNENEITTPNYPTQNSENGYFELLDIDVNDFEEERTTHHITSDEIPSTPDYTEDQLKLLYQRIFNSLQRNLDESTNQRVYEQFLNCFHQLQSNEAKLLITSPENISDSDAYWKQSTLESKMWSLCTEELPNEHL